MSLKTIGVAVVTLLVIVGSVWAANVWPKTPSGPLMATDLSWPNCSIVPRGLSAGIVGVTGGLIFYPNPCLRAETELFSSYQLYVNTGYPGISYALEYASSPLRCSLSNEACLAYNFGFNAGKYAVKYANAQQVHASFWWLDVETDNSWSTNPVLNRAALEGMVSAISNYSFLTKLGFYSSSFQWQAITDNWQPDNPAWVATGSTNYGDALAACQEPSFTGGPLALSQYTSSLDKDVNCL